MLLRRIDAGRNVSATGRTSAPDQAVCSWSRAKAYPRRAALAPRERPCPTDGTTPVAQSFGCASPVEWTTRHGPVRGCRWLPCGVTDQGPVAGESVALPIEKPAHPLGMEQHVQQVEIPEQADIMWDVAVVVG